MTPAEHYTRAEACLDTAQQLPTGSLPEAAMIARAQTHATLAAAGAAFLSNRQGDLYNRLAASFGDVIA